MSEHVTLDRAVVERLLGDLSAVRTAMGPGRPSNERLDDHIAALRGALRGAEPEMPSFEDWAGSPADLAMQADLAELEHADPAVARAAAGVERALDRLAHPDDYVRPENLLADPMPEPPSGSVVVTIDGRDVEFIECHRSAPDRAVYGTAEPVRGRTLHNQQEVAGYRDRGTEVRRG